MKIKKKSNNSFSSFIKGIYDENLRFDKMLEDVQTIRKAVDQINTLSSQSKLSAKDYNQM